MKFRKPKIRRDALITWSRPDSPPPAVCSVCFGHLPEVPLTLWNEQGGAASFCEECVKTLFQGGEDEDPRGT